MTDVVALIVAAGRGSRFAADSPSPSAPKQYRSLGGIPLLRRAILACFSRSVTSTWGSRCAA